MKKSTTKTKNVRTTEEVLAKMKRGARLLVSLKSDGKGYLESVAKRKQDLIPAAVVKELLGHEKVGHKTKSKEFKIFGIK
jgi:hypothetical protein